MAAPDVKPGAPGGRTEPFIGQKGASVPNGSLKVTVYEIASGRAAEVWPVDARELVASGEYSRTPPTLPGPLPTPDPASPAADPPAPEPAPSEPAPSEPTASRRARSR